MERKGNTVQLQASIQKATMADLRKLAKEEKRSLSNLVSLLLDQAILPNQKPKNQEE